MFKLNFLNRNEGREPVKESREEINNHAEEELVAEQSVDDSGLDFSDTLKDLREAISIQKELGGSLSPEDVMRITGMDPEALHDFLSGQETAIEAKGADVMSEIESALISLDKENTDKSATSAMRRFSNNPKVKAAFIALMLFAKFAPQAQGAEQHDLEKNKMEISNEKDNHFNHEPDPEKTYSLSADDFGDKPDSHYQGTDAKHLESSLEESGRLINLDLTNYFATDKAEILDAPAIQADFEAFLDKITPDNADEIIASDFTLFGASDERPTSNWEGSNENLTEARLNSLDILLSQTLDNHKFKNLSDEVVQQIKAKTFIHDMPVSTTGPEKGVTYITDLDNPDTGEKYTKAEVEDIKQNNPDQYKQLLDNCRHINFSVSLPKIDHLDPMPMKSSTHLEGQNIELHPVDIPKITNLAQYENVSLLFDNSPSVGNSYSYMADVIEGQNLHGLKINFATFSKNLDNIQQMDNPAAVAEEIRNIEYDGDYHERVLDVVNKALKKMPEGKKNVILAMTDEKLQDISWEKIQETRLLAEEKSSEVYFYYGDDKNKVLRQISLDDLEKAYSDQALQKLSGRVEMIHKIANGRIAALESQKANKTDLMERLAERAQNPSIQENIVSTQEKLAELEVQINQEKEKIAPLLAAWDKGDLKALFAQQKNFDLKVGGGKMTQEFNEDMAFNLAADQLGFEAADLAATN